MELKGKGLLGYRIKVLGVLVLQYLLQVAMGVPVGKYIPLQLQVNRNRDFH